ncbi:MAG: serine hydrolase [Butyrivibrio sp.]|nr:serine hydrolase [Butyrivibrio sp.]
MGRSNYRRKDGRRLSNAEYKIKRKREIIVHLSMLIAAIIAVVGIIGFVIFKLTHKTEQEPVQAEIIHEEPIEEIPVETSSSLPEEIVEEEPEEKTGAYMAKSEDAASFFEGYNIDNGSAAYLSSENTLSTYAILVNLDTGKTVASREGTTKIYPASMTKILTLLVAVEHLDNIDNTFTMTREIGDFVFGHECSVVGFEVDEVIPIKDLLYGTILPSGGDAAMCLAEYIAGSQEAFVDMMNEKLTALGLSDTAHFTNCIGIYNDDHYCTLEDMAVILKAAEENALCHEVLNARTYHTSPTAQHPDGMQISNWFLRRIEDKDTHGTVTGAKTGFVNQSGSCGASYQISNDGTHYICVTANAGSSWRCIYDHVDIYSKYTN